MKRTARCACGQLSRPLDGEPVLNALCHCTDCRRRTGSAFGWNAYFLEAQVGTPSGTVTQREVPVSAPQLRHSCPDCGTMLWWTAGTAPGLIGIAAGALEPALDQPIATYADDQRCPWLVLPDGLVSYP